MNGSKDVLFGDVTTSTLDIGDIQKLGSDGKITSQGALLHEITESSVVQNGGTPKSGHLRGTGMEATLNGISTRALLDFQSQ